MVRTLTANAIAKYRLLRDLRNMSFPDERLATSYSVLHKVLEVSPPRALEVSLLIGLCSARSYSFRFHKLCFCLVL